MIYVTVGTDTHDFSRLVKRMDEIARKREVIMQIGRTRYKPKNAKWFRFETNEIVSSFYKKTDVIVTHAGAGSIIRSLREGKVPIVVPRLKRLGEHVNDHQLDLARSLEKKGKVLLVEDVEKLEDVMESKKTPCTIDRRLVHTIGNFLVEHEKNIS